MKHSQGSLLMGPIRMRLDDGTILMHGRTPYDPVKAHQYYLRTRQLKGRKTGSSSFSVRTPDGKTVVLSARELAEQKAYASKRVNDIKTKLTELNSKLKKALSEARKKKSTTRQKADKPETAADKSKAARESKQYKEKHKTEIATKSRRAAAKAKSKSKTKTDDPVAHLEEQIGEIRRHLLNAVLIQRALAGAIRKS